MTQNQHIKSLDIFIHVQVLSIMDPEQVKEIGF